MTVLDKVRQTFRNVEIGTEFTTAEIKQMVATRFNVNPGSVIPSDYCYNMTNKGKIGSLVTFNIFIQVKHGLYKYVGEHYSR